MTEEPPTDPSNLDPDKRKQLAQRDYDGFYLNTLNCEDDTFKQSEKLMGQNKDEEIS